MADKKQVLASFDQALQASRQDRNQKLAQQMLGTDPKKLAQEMLGKNRRTTTARAPAAPASLASRVGVVKRSASLPRSQPAPLRNSRQPSHLSRPLADDNYRPRSRDDVITISSSEHVSDAKSNGYARPEASNGGGLNIRGAAGPYIVHAENFAPGTTAADIESVMQNIGGMMVYCKLVATAPTVVAEMSFVDRSGADKVIDVFHNKKADGRVLQVHFVGNNAPAPAHSFSNNNGRSKRAPSIEEEEPLPTMIVDVVGDTDMEVDSHAEAREAQDRQREQRRSGGGRDDREPSQRYPTGPRQPNEVDGNHRPEPRREQSYQQDRRYGGGGGGYEGGNRRFGGGGGGGGRGGRGGYRGEGRMYSDGMRRGGGGQGQGYRP